MNHAQSNFSDVFVFLLVSTGFFRRASDRIMATPWPALAAGTAVLLGTPMLAMLLLITLIGIPLSIALMMLFPLLMLMGWIVGVFSISQRVKRALQNDTPSKQSLSPDKSSGAMIGFFALMLLLVLLLGSVPLIGALMLVAIMLLGTGACALELVRQFRSRRSPPGSGASGSGSPTGVPSASAL